MEMLLRWPFVFLLFWIILKNVTEQNQFAIESNSTLNTSYTYLYSSYATPILILKRPENYNENLSSTSIQTIDENYNGNGSSTSDQLTPGAVSSANSTYIIVLKTIMYALPGGLDDISQINASTSFSSKTVSSTSVYGNYSAGPTAEAATTKTFKLMYPLDFNAAVTNLSGMANATALFCKTWLSFAKSVTINCSIAQGSIFVMSQVRGTQVNVNQYGSTAKSNFDSNKFNVVVFNSPQSPDPNSFTIDDQSTTQPASTTSNNKSYIVIIVVVGLILLSVIIIGVFVHLSKKKKRKVKNKASSTNSLKELHTHPSNQSKRGGTQNHGKTNQAFQE